MPRSTSTPGTFQPVRVFLARIAYGDLVIERLRHLREKARQLAAADDQQPPAGPVHALQRFAVECEQVLPVAGTSASPPVSHIEQAHDQLVPLDALQELFDPALRRYRLEHELQRAAARQAETCACSAVTP